MQFEESTSFVNVVNSPIEGGIVPLIVYVDRSISTKTSLRHVTPAQKTVLLQGSFATIPSGVHCHIYLPLVGILGDSCTSVAAMSPQRALS